VRLHCVTCTGTGTIIATLAVAVAVASRSASGPRPVSVPRAVLVVTVFQNTRSKQQRNLLVTQTCCRPVAAAEPATSGGGHCAKGLVHSASLPRKQRRHEEGRSARAQKHNSVSAACVLLDSRAALCTLLLRLMANLAAAAAGRLSQAAILSAPATAPVPSRTLAEAQQRARYFYRQVRPAVCKCATRFAL
jgi:hypothetical protein